MPKRGSRPPGPPVVAELGRPESAQETADRKAKTSRVHRENQTARNLVGALVVSLGVVLLIVLVVVRPAPPPPEPIDYAATAAEAQPTVDEQLIAPAMSDEWRANSATLQRTGGVTTWYVGFITPSEQFIGMRQGIEANETWLAAQLGDTRLPEPVTIDDTTWTSYDNRTAKDTGNLAYAMTIEQGESTIVLFGTAPDEEFASLAAAVTAEYQEGDR